MKVVFLHPDLGIGGAERLVVDAAVALQNKGHDVKVITNHYDSSHCFKETEQLDVKVYSYFPQTIFGQMFALCAYIRMIIAAFIIGATMDYDVIFSDQVSASQVIFRLFFWKPARLIFYCHHPDLLLTDRKTTAKSAYRLVLDFVEEQTTRLADVICVNSLYTAEITKKTFGSLKDRELTVLYPSVNTDFFDKAVESTLTDIPASAEHVFSSLNRFEVKKNVLLALEAFAKLKNLLSADDYAKCHLVIAGGYDKRNEENIAYYSQLVKYAQDLELKTSQITFMRSPSDQDKISLLKRSTAILYTPDKEHFGIVPVETMYLGRPVIAVNTGGPLETIDHEKTGFLVEQKPIEFAKCMAKLIAEPQLRKTAQIEGPKRVRNLFAFPAFSSRLDQIVRNEI